MRKLSNDDLQTSRFKIAVQVIEPEFAADAIHVSREAFA